MVVMDLSSQNLIRWPDSVFQKPGLTHLFAGINGGVLTSFLGIMHKPVHNYISFIPEKFCAIRSLKVINLTYNTIDTLPGCFSSLDNLESLNLSFNPHLDVRQSIPIIAKLKKLKELNLFYVPEALKDSNWVRRQFAGRDIKLTITEDDMFKHYGRHESQ